LENSDFRDSERDNDHDTDHDSERDIESDSESADDLYLNKVNHLVSSNPSRSRCDEHLHIRRSS